MKQAENNFAFIDSQNVYRGIKSQGWEIDWFRFRKYLREKYSVTTAYMFLGYIPTNDSLYELLQKAGFILKFKPVIPDEVGKPKGNVDADLVLQVMIVMSKHIWHFSLSLRNVHIYGSNNPRRTVALA